MYKFNVFNFYSEHICEKSHSSGISLKNTRRPSCDVISGQTGQGTFWDFWYVVQQTEYYTLKKNLAWEYFLQGQNLICLG